MRERDAPPAGPEHGSAEPDEKPPARARIGRRVLFATGGLAILWASRSPARQSDSTSHAAAPAAPAAPLPGAPHNAPARGPTTGFAEPQYYVHDGPKTVALTLDDGPSALYTPQILELLNEYSITATFSMIGSQIAANRSLVVDVAAAGHAIANHTWDHVDLTKLTTLAVTDQIARTNDALADAGVVPALFRAPFGTWNTTVLHACAAADLRPLDWSVDPHDWARPGVQSIVDNIMTHTRTGSIILEHDGGGDRSQTIAALAIALPELLARGYRFTTV